MTRQQAIEKAIRRIMRRGLTVSHLLVLPEAEVSFTVSLIRTAFNNLRGRINE